MLLMKASELVESNNILEGKTSTFKQKNILGTSNADMVH
jgi:hypothetical protein